MQESRTSPTETDPNPLLRPIEAILRASQGAAQTEFSLIQTLKAEGLVAPDYSLAPLTLFRVHFQVFNALHRLQPVFAQQGQVLVISPLAIYLRPLAEGEGAVAEAGDAALRDFYLDWREYERATGDSVEALLSDFWRLMGRRGEAGGDERQEALAELGLEDPVSPELIKRRYRRLAMDHHPDRGGSEVRLQRINAAMALLEHRR